MEQILPVFSSNIVTCIIEKNTDVLKKETKFANNDYQKDTGRDTYRVLEKYPKVKKTLLEKYKKFAREQLNYKENFQISTSWITKIETGGQCQQHCHKNSFYSGVYYFDEYEQNKGGKLEFQTPLMNLPDFHLIPKEWNFLNSNVIEITPVKNLLVLFPSYLFHRVLVYQGTSVRRSLSFNIVPTGSYGSGDSSS
tara:strand:+ start:243 stop:827 length:585 start_codon:yes stop_codon:yes gene_type:complete